MTIYMEPTLALLSQIDQGTLMKIEGFLKATSEGTKYIIVKEHEQEDRSKNTREENPQNVQS